jgi:hypothetical protein
MQTEPGGSMKIRQAVTLILCLMAGVSPAGAQTYGSVSLDSAGQLSIIPSAGAIFKAPRLRDQVSFSQPSLSTDHRTLAWLANYPDPTAPPGSADPIAGRLVLYRAGRVLRTYRTDQVFWSWQFVQDGKDVAFCTGPSHGGADTCELHRISSGHRLATWSAHAAGDPPPWVKGLGY